MTNTWFITGASRGLGMQAALAHGDQVVATSRRPERVREALSGSDDQLLTVALDVTDDASIQAAVQAAVDRFGRIDVLVNNAGFAQLGNFEELSTGAIDRQFRTNVFGVFDVTRSVLPIMRAQRSGHVVTISSTLGIVGADVSSIYAAAKFAVAGWSESLSLELAPFGIRATSVHPGPFRTDFLEPMSVQHGDVPIDDYREIREARETMLASFSSNQAGDPVRFGQAIIALVKVDEPPVRWAAGSEAISVFLQRADELQTTAQTWEDLSRSTDIQ